MTNDALPTHLPESPTRAQALHLLLSLTPTVLAERLIALGGFSPEDRAQLLDTPRAELPGFFTIAEDYYREARLHEFHLYEGGEGESRMEAALIRHTVAQSVLRAAHQKAVEHYEALKRERTKPRLLEDHRAFEHDLGDALDAVTACNEDLADADALARLELGALMDAGEYLPQGVPILLRATNTGGSAVKVKVDFDADSARVLSF